MRGIAITLICILFSTISGCGSNSNTDKVLQYLSPVSSVGKNNKKNIEKKTGDVYPVFLRLDLWLTFRLGRNQKLCAIFFS